MDLQLHLLYQLKEVHQLLKKQIPALNLPPIMEVEEFPNLKD